MRPQALILLFIIALAASCSRQPDYSPVPRRVGYPRVAVYDSIYVTAKGAPVAFEVNERARQHATRKGGAVWLNIDYVDYQASVYCTFTPVTPATVDEVIENRAERLDLNLNGAHAEFMEFITDNGFVAALATAPTATSTPLQFLASTDEWVLSGAVFFKHAERITDIDSVAPMVETIRRDLLHGLQGL